CDEGIAVTGPGVAHYENADMGTGEIKVQAALPIAEQPDAGHRFDVVVLAEIAAAATLIPPGSWANVLEVIRPLAGATDAGGYQSLGYAREVTLKLGDNRDDWVTELQEPIAPQSAA